MGSQSAIKAGAAYVQLFADDSALVKGLNQAQARLKSFGNAVKAVGIGFTALGGSIITPILASARAFAATGFELDRMSKKTGIGVESLSEISYAASQSGVEMGELERAIRHMQKTIVEGSEGMNEANTALIALGLSAADLRKLSPDDQFTAIAEKLELIQDPALKAAAAMRIMGEKSATKILPLLYGLKQLRKEGHNLGVTMTRDDVAAAVALERGFLALKSSLLGVANAIGSAVAPMLTEYFQIATKMVSRTSEWIRNNKQIVVGVLATAAAVTVMGTALTGAAYGMVLLGQAIGVASAILTTLAEVMGVVEAFGASVVAAIAAPEVIAVGLILAALSALFVALLYYGGILDDAWNTSKRVFGYIADSAIKAFEGIKNALKDGNVELAFKIMFAAINLEWTKGINALWDKWVSFTNKLVGLDNITNALKGASGAFSFVTGSKSGNSDVDKAQKDYDDLLGQANGWQGDDHSVLKALQKKFGSDGDSEIGEAMKGKSAGLFNVGNNSTAFELGSASGPMNTLIAIQQNAYQTLKKVEQRLAGDGQSVIV